MTDESCTAQVWSPGTWRHYRCHNPATFGILCGVHERQRLRAEADKAKRDLGCICDPRRLCAAEHQPDCCDAGGPMHFHCRLANGGKPSVEVLREALDVLEALLPELADRPLLQEKIRNTLERRPSV